MDQKRTKWRLDGHAWVISKIEECSDLDEMLETMPMKFERKRTWGKHLTRNHKHYVQNECDFLTIRIRRKRRKRRILMGQNVNENKAMTKVVIAKMTSWPKRVILGRKLGGIRIVTLVQMRFTHNFPREHIPYLVIRKGTSSQNHCHLRTYCSKTRYYVKHSKFIIFGDNLARRALKFTKLSRQLSRICMCAKFHWRYKDREQVEVISQFSWKWRIWRAIFSNLVSDRVYNFVYGWKGHIFKYLNPKKGTGLPSHYGDTATEKKEL